MIWTSEKYTSSKDDWMSVTLIASVFSSNYIYQNYFGIGTEKTRYVTIFSLCRQQQLRERKKIKLQ